MPARDHYSTRVRLISLVIFPFDVVLGVGLLLAPHTAQSFLDMGRVPEPAFIRATGLFTLLLGYLYYQTFRDPQGCLILFRVSAVARLLLAMLHFCEAQFLIARPLFLTHYLFYAMSLADAMLFAVQAYVLSKMGRRWLVV